MAGGRRVVIRTFGKVDVSGAILSAMLRGEIVQERLHALLARRDQVDRLHGLQRLPHLLDGLDDGDALGRQVLHLGAGGHHTHALVVDDEHAPLDLAGRLVVRLRRRPDHVVHDLCKADDSSRLIHNVQFCNKWQRNSAPSKGQ